MRDEFNLHRGYWEAKDTDDVLTAEIQKKAAKGYPLFNTIFEDTRRAVLFQNGIAALVGKSFNREGFLKSLERSC